MDQAGRDEAAQPRQADDEPRQRAERAREPKAAGATPSGLPKRVPRANLVPGSARPGTRSGRRVSRAPDDVRGRLTDLRRGVREGHRADPGR